MAVGCSSEISNALNAYQIRKPEASEVPGIKALIDRAVVQGLLLPRTHAELYDNLGEFFVCVDSNGVGGCCALHLDTPEVAEIWSLVVREDLRGQGIGARLLDVCIEEARRHGVARVYALSHAPEFFHSHFFREIDRYELPYKVARDCIQCHQFMHCSSIAMIRDLDAVVSGAEAQARRG